MKEENPKITRKELEKLQRRNQILVAARKCFLSKGFASTTLDEIAAAAELGKGTIYLYFENKDELLWGLVVQFHDESVTPAKKAIESSSGTLREKFLKYATVVMSRSAEHDFFHLLLRESNVLQSPHFEKRLVQIRQHITALWQILALPIEAEMDKGTICKGDALRLAGLFDHMVRGFGIGTQSKLLANIGGSRKEIIDLIVRTFFDGIMNNEARDN